MLVVFLLFLLEKKQGLAREELINPIFASFVQYIYYVSLRFLLHLNSFSGVYTLFGGKHAFGRVFVGFPSFSEQRCVKDDVP